MLRVPDVAIPAPCGELHLVKGGGKGPHPQKNHNRTGGVAPVYEVQGAEFKCLYRQKNRNEIFSRGFGFALLGRI